MEIEVKQFRTLRGNQQLRAQAMKMYMSGIMYPTEIASKLNIDINELGHYVFGPDKTGESPTCWKSMKDRGQVPKFVDTYEEVKVIYIKKTEKKLLDMANQIIDNLSEKEKIDDMETKDLINIINSLEKVDRIGRLEEDKPTQNVITERKSFTLRDIIAKAKSSEDQIQDAKFTELPNNSNTIRDGESESE